MDIKDIFSLILGLSIFLFGMKTMSDSLESRSKETLKRKLQVFTDSTFKGLLLGTAITSVIQSSSATTVITVGFVGAGVMTLNQAVAIIMGANIGTCATSWILSLSSVGNKNIYAEFLMPQNFVAALALCSVAVLLFSKNEKRKLTASALLGFSTLMTGMQLMTNSVSGLTEIPEFTKALTYFENPILGLLAGTVFTAVIQSSSASVGVLQALSSTGVINLGLAVPIIMGQNIGTCITAVLSAIGSGREAKRTAFVHLYFNVFGAFFLLLLFLGAKGLLRLNFVDRIIVGGTDIAIIHTAFNVLCTVIWLPFTKTLTKLAIKTIK